jgi:hypothetical protein
MKNNKRMILIRHNVILNSDFFFLGGGADHAENRKRTFALIDEAFSVRIAVVRLLEESFCIIGQNRASILFKNALITLNKAFVAILN